MSARGCAEPVLPIMAATRREGRARSEPVTSQARVYSMWLRICLCLDAVCAIPVARPSLGAMDLMMEGAAAIGAEQRSHMAALEMQLKELKDRKRVAKHDKKLKDRRDARLVVRAHGLSDQDLITMLVIVSVVTAGLGAARMLPRCAKQAGHA